MMTAASASRPVREETPVATASEIFAFPVSCAQQRFWFLDQFQPASPLCHLAIAIRAQGPLEPLVLEQAVNQIVRRHEILRTSFHLQKGQLLQLVASSLVLRLSNVDLISLSPANREAEARRLAAEEARRPFDLKRLPLFRIKLLRLSATEHILVLTAHHIIFDAWSVAVFFRELAALYRCLQAGKPPDLPEPPVQYADFTVWKQERLQSLDKELAWWKKRLRGNPPPLELPADRPRPALRSYRGAVESLAVNAALREPLQELSRRENATPFMTLLAAFQILLFRYSGQEDILVGAPVAGRNWTETEQLIGLFSNTLVMRGDLSGNPTFRDFLGRVREMAVDAYVNQDVPFERLVEELRLAQSLSRSPLFQVMFAFERAPLESVDWPELTISQLPLDCGTAKCDLMLDLVEGSSDLTARIEYSTDLFDSSTIRRMLAHFHALLEGITADPDRRLSDLPLLTASERHQLFVEWNRTQTDYPREKTLHELFEAQVARSPDAVAAALAGQQVTYRELDQAASQVAHHLRALGVGPDTSVGICLDRSVKMIIGLLGILKAGGAYLPLEPTYPKERLAFMLEDSRSSLVLTQRRLLDALPRRAARLVCLDSDWNSIASASPEKIPPSAGSEQLAYVIYTSGSTGRPEGVQIPHRAVVNFLYSMQREPGLSSQDALLAATTLSFDIAALELFLPLTVGARVVLATREETTDGVLLARKIASAAANVVQATPATWRMLLDSGWTGDKSLRIFCGGEPLSRELANQLLERSAELWNLYGPTETTVWSAAAKIEPGNDPIAVGRPIANTEFHILDPYLQPVPVGVPGELFIGGDGLARGYLNRPELTAEKFLPDPFRDGPNARMYRTGDRARWLNDGRVELLGRMDHQVKILGFRIEPSEIESALLQFPRVREAVVVVNEDTSDEKRLVAFLTTYRQTTVSINGLRRFLREKLPDYMVPSTFVLLDNLPLTPNGKVDRRALRAPGDFRPKMDTAFVPPDPGVEEKIAGIWERILAIRNPGATDNFFDLGGRSLQVLQVCKQLHDALGIDLPVIKLFQYPTIRLLAAHLAGEKKEDPFARKIRERTQRAKAAAVDHRQFGARVRL
jgi:amino acid adenylation domain-containing protein